MKGALQSLLSDLEEHVLRRSGDVRFQVVELGLFVEFVHLALASLLDFEPTQGIDTWHKHLGKAGIEVHPAWYQELKHIYGSRNIVSHRNVDAGLFTTSTVRRYLEVVHEKVPDLSRKLSSVELDFEAKLMEVQTASPHRRRAALLFGACMVATDESEARIRDELFPVLREMGAQLPGKRAGKVRDRLSICLVALSDQTKGDDNCVLRDLAARLNSTHPEPGAFRDWLNRDLRERVSEPRPTLPVFRVELWHHGSTSWVIRDATVLYAPELSKCLYEEGFLPDLEVPSGAELYKAVRNLFKKVRTAAPEHSNYPDISNFILEFALPASIAAQRLEKDRLEDLHASPTTKALCRLFHAVVIDPIEDEHDPPEAREIEPDALLGLGHNVALLWGSGDVYTLQDEAGNRPILVAGPTAWRTASTLGRAPIFYCLDRVAGAILCPHEAAHEATRYLGLEATQSWSGLLGRLKGRDKVVASQPTVFWTDPRHRIEPARSTEE